MMINTKKVQGRRKVRYESFDELLEEAEQFAAKNVRTLGNWSQGQIYEHIAQSLNSSIDGMDMSFPAPARWLMSLLMKKRFLTKELPPGFKSAEKFIPDETSTEDGLASLQQAVERQKQDKTRVAHPGFGNIGEAGWTAFHLRHAEMHMSFLVPVDA